MQTFFQDLRFGFRMLRRSPGFSVLALFCLTLEAIVITASAGRNASCPATVTK
jgi:hypothetical protein